MCIPKEQCKYMSVPLNRGLLIIENSLELGTFINYDEAFSFVDGLEYAKKQLQELFGSNQEQLFELYNVFLAGCFEKAEEIFDDLCSFETFVRNLFPDWVVAAQISMSPEVLLKRLENWENSDDYGLASGVWLTVVPYLNAESLICLLSSLHKKLIEHKSEEYVFKSSIELIKAIYMRQCDIDSYVELTKKYGLCSNDYLSLANMYISKKQSEKSFSWVVKGFALTKRDYSLNLYALKKLKRELLLDFGRDDEALEDAWIEFSKKPSEYSYDDLKKYTGLKSEETIDRRVIALLEKCSVGDAVEVCVHIGEIDVLARRIESARRSTLKGLSHFRTEPAAEILEKDYPYVSAKLYECLGIRIVDQAKSKYYTEAHQHLRKSKELYEKAGHTAKWKRVIDYVRQYHKRKYSFMGEFERIIVGKPEKRCPSFSQRIEKRLKSLLQE